MPVLLSTRAALPGGGFDAWAALDAAEVPLPDALRHDTARELEAAFPQAARRWWDLARGLAKGPGADLAHAVVCSPNASDLGLMLAWTQLVDAWAVRPPTLLVICDDPWLFRHLAGRPGVTAGPPPPLLRRRLTLALRGMAARLRYAVRAAWTARRLHRHRERGDDRGRPFLLVYGHPRSGVDGTDAYFGPLMNEVRDLRRVLHVDSSAALVAALDSDPRTAPLVAWGRPAVALARLPFARWRPHAEGPESWLVRRAAALEGGTGTAAAIRWQKMCQRAWLASVRPAAIAWPWENHAWERDLVRAARAAGIRTVGYQHSVVGTQTNFSTASYPDGAAAFPDMLVCNGEAARDQMRAYGAPPERLALGGALRYPAPPPVRRDFAAPLFLALPFDVRVALQMIAAAREVAAKSGLRFLAKEHPLFPVPFEDGGGVVRTRIPLPEQPALAGVIFCASTVGLEALAACLPVLRFLPRGTYAVNILPESFDVPATDAAGLHDAVLALENAPSPDGRLVQEANFSPVDLAVWRQNLEVSTP